MNSHMVGPDPDARKVRLCLVAALVIIGVLAWVGTADAAPVAGGGCAGYTWAQGTVVAFSVGPFYNTLTVRVGSDYGTRLTVERWQRGQRVLVTGIACGGVFDYTLRVRRG